MKKNLLLILLLIFTNFLFAQETPQMRVEGKGELLQSEMVAKDVRDVNGEVCAGLIIEHNLDGLNFDSYNKIVKVTSNPGSDFLFLSPTEQVVTIYKTGYTPLKIILNEYGIKLKSGEVWKITVTGDKLQSELIPIVISVEPSDALVSIDGEKKGVGPTFQVSAGTHKVTISKSGYRTITETIEVNKNNILFNYKLEQIAEVSVFINSDPEEAEIYIDNFKRGSTPKDLWQYPDKYNLRLSKSGYVDVIEEIEVKETGNNTFNFTLSKNSGTLQLSVSPSEAEIVIDREAKTSNSSYELAPGRHSIQITAKGYREIDEIVEITKGEVIKKQYNLEKITGKLLFTVKPREASVTLKREGKTIEAWQGAKSLNDLLIGNFELEISALGYETEKIAITIKENETIKKDINLKEKTAAAYLSGPIEMVFVEGGSFEMGSNDGDSDEKPIHTVRVDDFYIGKYEVTQKEWKEIMGNNPSRFKRDNLPVEKVSWNDVQEFIRKLNQKTGGNYRLPTEAEWEYASRGGKSSAGYKYSGSNNLDEVGWYDDNSGDKTNEVGTKKPNELGIYDMSGNVWEWCSDWYNEDYYSNSPSNNPQGPSSGSICALRGGSWDYDGDYCRVSNRGWFNPDYRLGNVGIRLARTYL